MSYYLLTHYELLTLLSTIGDDAIYCDTDSIKVRNYTKHIEQIREYNSANRVDLSAAMQYHGLPDSAFEPMGYAKTRYRNGEEHKK